LRLILNLLDISKSEEGALVVHSAELGLESLTSEVIDALGVSAQGSGVRLERRLEAAKGEADLDLSRRVLENLVDNAIRHAPSGSTVTLSAERTGERVLLAVSDAGPGIDPELKTKIFERYVRIESGDRGAARLGRGLGLSFCKLA